MTDLSINTAQVRQAGNDLGDVDALLRKGIEAALTVQALVNAHWTLDERSQRIHQALQDWHDFAPGFQHDIQSASDFLVNVVAPTYENLGRG